MSLKGNILIQARTTTFNTDKYVVIDVMHEVPYNPYDPVAGVR